ncbi:DUF2190 family protein [Xanthomonas arboricola pv. juglandis]|uniref:structural cement protein Gp24 n=1 Tax=Xanthomonas arboricola TaxID=56448 RepID=UPI00063EAAA1|nr:DUF2190 family protein [Xanthomonas arboricola]MDN0220762.1 DUF2190 family protein [Xanthomonas arboricola pv. juglandis]MDN0225085.1 DUF2190 family protein [Xanthomonas arboricola pv. juglandis]MDN0229299.1 DUF2190 family protein [Xanthomonas arboricola pv. juglandis]MDN0233671.1 DUF2190 family protein [Xanthomonas arboricola pv. juglandis]MDN0237931.1 DUF2190 family protein [Xanthomonas arboricola pv. juglandis]
MALQTNYPDIQPAAVRGMQATMIPATVISRTVEDVAGLAFGLAVAQGTTDKGIVTFGGANLKFVGITLLDRSATGLDLFPQRASARVITKGDIWVTASVAVAAGDPVYLTAAGAFTNVATNNTAITGARWDTSTTAAAQLAVVRLG